MIQAKSLVLIVILIVRFKLCPNAAPSTTQIDVCYARYSFHLLVALPLLPVFCKAQLKAIFVLEFYYLT